MPRRLMRFTAMFRIVSAGAAITFVFLSTAASGDNLAASLEHELLAVTNEMLTLDPDDFDHCIDVFTRARAIDAAVRTMPGISDDKRTLLVVRDRDRCGTRQAHLSTSGGNRTATNG